VPQKHVLSIASDPIVGDRLYLATNGSGIFVWGAESRGQSGGVLSGGR
jgi:hypothetical protein